MRKSPVPSDQFLDIDLREFLFSDRAIFMPWLRAFRHFHLGLAFFIAHHDQLMKTTTVKVAVLW